MGIGWKPGVTVQELPSGSVNGTERLTSYVNGEESGCNDFIYIQAINAHSEIEADTTRANADEDGWYGQEESNKNRQIPKRMLTRNPTTSPICIRLLLTQMC